MLGIGIPTSRLNLGIGSFTALLLRVQFVTCANAGPVPAPKLAYPWTNWLALKAPRPIASSPFFQHPVGPAAPDVVDADTSPEAFANYFIARSILPAAGREEKEGQEGFFQGGD